MITYPCPNSNQIMFIKQPQDNIEANWYASCHIIWTIMINHKGSVVDRCIFRWHLPVGRSVMDYVVPCLVQYIDVNIGYNFQIQPFVPCHLTQRRITQRANTSAAPIFWFRSVTSPDEFLYGGWCGTSSKCSLFLVSYLTYLEISWQFVYKFFCNIANRHSLPQRKNAGGDPEYPPDISNYSLCHVRQHILKIRSSFRKIVDIYIY